MLIKTALDEFPESLVLLASTNWCWRRRTNFLSVSHAFKLRAPRTQFRASGITSIQSQWFHVLLWNCNGVSLLHWKPTLWVLEWIFSSQTYRKELHNLAQVLLTIGEEAVYKCEKVVYGIGFPWVKLRRNRSGEHSVLMPLTACDVFLQPGHNRQPNQTVQEKLELASKK